MIKHAKLEIETVIIGYVAYVFADVLALPMCRESIECLVTRKFRETRNV